MTIFDPPCVVKEHYARVLKLSMRLRCVHTAMYVIGTLIRHASLPITIHVSRTIIFAILTLKNKRFFGINRACAHSFPNRLQSIYDKLKYV